MEIAGDKEVLAALKKADRELNSKLRSSVRRAAKPMLDMAKQLVPRDTGQLASTLKIRALKRSRRNKNIVGVRVITDPALLQQIVREDPSQVHNPLWHEVGTRDQPATPFMRPAMHSTAAAVQAAIAADVAKMF